jgi:hypothetical protein
MNYDKNNKYVGSLIQYILGFCGQCGGEQTFRENIHPPVMCPREVFAKIARDFQMLCILF